MQRSQSQRERRRDPRVKCRYPCEIHGSLQSGEGTVLDMSEGGLSIRTALDLDQGESLKVSMKLPSGTLQIEALLWHCRRGRARGSGEVFSILGLMVTAPPEDYLGLFAKLHAEPAVDRPTHTPRSRPEASSRATPTPSRDPEPAAAATEEADADEPALGAYRIRVKHRTGPRTRVLSLTAESEKEAGELAAEDLGPEWEILEVSAA